MNALVATSTTPPATTAGGMLDGFEPLPGVYDELYAAPGMRRPHWRYFVDELNMLGADDFSQRREQAIRLVHDNGLMYNALGDAAQTARPWDLDVLPVIIGADEWHGISAALVQRAKLLNRVMVDLYCPQRLLT